MLDFENTHTGGAAALTPGGFTRDRSRRAAEKTPEPVEPLASGTSREAQPRRVQRNAAIAVGLFLTGIIGAGGYVYWDHAAHFQSTDDAFFAARQFSLAPKVGGYLISVPVTDNQHVQAGDVIAQIDDRDFRIAVAQAEAQVGSAEAAIHTSDAQIAAQGAQVASAQAQLVSAQAALVFAQQQADRYATLARSGSGAVLNAQQTASQLDQARAAADAARAALTVAERQVDTLKAQRSGAEASLAQAKAQLDQARLNLSYTAVTAAQAGRVANLSAGVGELAQPGTALATLVPDEIWITANFKETQLDAMRAGQPVEISVDAYPDHVLHGHVASIQPGSGTAFSLLPAENATGNYVKVVQRVPVKIVLDHLPPDLALGPGVSVVPTVRVNAAPSLYERLTGAFARR